ncbi:MAG: hypothetical protein MOB07_31430 [Acidobacteria bacterium]|nr:hypothetical protein [Acidobacteriota bacterium]
MKIADVKDAEVRGLYEAAAAIIHNCQHEDQPCEVSAGGRATTCCNDCYNASVVAWREARKVELQKLNDALPRCQRCGVRPMKWDLGGYDLCGRCKTLTNREHHKAAAQAGHLGLFSGMLVNTSTWAFRALPIKEEQ